MLALIHAACMGKNFTVMYIYHTVALHLWIHLIM